MVHIWHDTIILRCIKDVFFFLLHSQGLLHEEFVWRQMLNQGLAQIFLKLILIYYQTKKYIIIFIHF